MAIDSIGQGNSRDPSIDSRRRLIEEERVRELDRLELKHKEQLDDAQNVRDKALRALFENQTAEISQKSIETDNRIAQVKSATDARIKEFEGDSRKMTDEAKRQFQTKANMLSKNAQELDQQRQQLVNMHDNTMKRLGREHESSEAENHLKFQRQANENYLNAQREIKTQQVHSNEELNLLRNEDADRKRGEIRQTERDLTSLKEQREMGKGAIAREIAFTRREGGEQLAHAREDLEMHNTHQQMQYEQQLNDLNRQAGSALTKSHSQGQKKMKDAADLYATQLDQLHKDHNAKVRDTQTKSSIVLSSMEEQAKTDEALARSNFATTKMLLQDKRSKALTESAMQNSTLSAKLAENYATQARVLTQERDRLIQEQSNAIGIELKNQRLHAQKKLNDSTVRNADALAGHEAKAVDPFYHVHAIAAQVEDLETEVLIYIDVPEHEQDKVRVTLQQGALAVSGSRRFEDKATLEDGHKVATNAYQTYSESFAVRGKLEMNKMSRSYVDGRLTFHIPKG